MAESEQGIHPDVMNHIVDLHRKHSELQMQMHDKGGEGSEPHEIFHQMLEELKKLNANLEKLTPAVDADAKADRKEAGADNNEGKNASRRRERGSKTSVSGESPSST